MVDFREQRALFLLRSGSVIPLVDHRGHHSRVRLKSVLNLADAYGGPVKLVGIIFDQGRQVKVAQSLTESRIAQGLIQLQENCPPSA